MTPLIETHTDTITVPEAAELLSVSERTIWRYVKSGRLQAETVGPPGSQRTLIARRDVDDARAARGHDSAADALRAERDRLEDELRAVVDERDALRQRVELLQRAAARSVGPGAPVRVLSAALTALNRARSLRAA